ncbi:branched-chain amino acid ABC transporter permease [Conexibacter woesei]|uniref:Inner-membrane translocator n=1 Tax=Conexibacter woesei (strain DSM 14684 / CCUG 47730 / CIP 108061 / JCM 11494 / NBRC 100937 / ID131577) TaxID=469383 RepID=D3FAP6_CONWI|nr:branched-chain amino acid ABC transporter permease [Conexibacter woesei]ADB51209.1 inner-membrane translocator [Conexibacter woesei DSM 14684]
MTELIQNVINALALGSIYALLALGIALMFGIMRLINFAHGELIMAGAYAMVLLQGDLWGPFVIVAAVAIVVGVSLLIERVAFRPVRGAPPETLLVTSFGVSFLLQSLATTIFGSMPRSGSVLPELSGAFTVGQLAVPKLDVAALVTTLVLFAAVALVLRRTPIGMQMRAAAEDVRTARTLGVRVNRVVAVAFAISGVLAGAAAVLLAGQAGSVDPMFGATAVLVAFVATVLGGMGSLVGAVLGAYLIGFLTIGLQAYLPADMRPFRDAFVYGTIILVFVLRPQGLIVPRAMVTRV